MSAKIVQSRALVILKLVELQFVYLTIFWHEPKNQFLIVFRNKGRKSYILFNFPTSFLFLFQTSSVPQKKLCRYFRATVDILPHSKNKSPSNWSNRSLCIKQDDDL